MTRKILLSWSSGKDAAWALHRLRQNPTVEVAGLLTTVNRKYSRVSMHAVRRELLLKQAEATGLDPWIVELPDPCSDREYEVAMGEVVERAKAQGFTAMAFGDLFLQDVREYREKRLAGTGLEALFPIWSRDTRALAGEMMSAGLKARITCVDPKVLDASFCGREWDEELLRDLPSGADPCGENGEFHTFAHAGPMFTRSIRIDLGNTVKRDGFVFTDIMGDAL